MFRRLVNLVLLFCTTSIALRGTISEIGPCGSLECSREIILHQNCGSDSLTYSVRFLRSNLFLIRTKLTYYDTHSIWQVGCWYSLEVVDTFEIVYGSRTNCQVKYRDSNLLDLKSGSLFLPKIWEQLSYGIISKVQQDSARGLSYWDVNSWAHIPDYRYYFNANRIPVGMGGKGKQMHILILDNKNQKRLIRFLKNCNI